jgi:gamma-glutamylcyclotransferase (GGCT)/AIG2-like uncharacterized protein YtfP
VRDGEVPSLLERANAQRRCGGVDEDAERTLEQTFACSRQLAVYGTLAPGQPNHHVVGPCAGQWVPAEVTGRLAVRDFPVFTWVRDGKAQRIWLLRSAALPAAWPRIDAFEGAGYRRVLVPVAAGSHHTVANVYEAIEPVRPDEVARSWASRALGSRSLPPPTGQA